MCSVEKVTPGCTELESRFGEVKAAWVPGVLISVMSDSPHHTVILRCERGSWLFDGVSLTCNVLVPD